MPVVGSSAYNTAGQITALVRALLNDAQGNLFTDTVLLPVYTAARIVAGVAVNSETSVDKKVTQRLRSVLTAFI